MGYVNKCGALRKAPCFFAGLPSPCFPYIRCIAQPLSAPMSNALLSLITVLLDNQVIADVKAKHQRVARDFFNTDYFEFGGFYARDLPQQSRNSLRKCARPGATFVVKPSSG